eukprot:Gb_12379 [translate_table: standard]
MGRPPRRIKGQLLPLGGVVLLIVSIALLSNPRQMNLLLRRRLIRWVESSLTSRDAIGNQLRYGLRALGDSQGKIEDHNGSASGEGQHGEELGEPGDAGAPQSSHIRHKLPQGVIHHSPKEAANGSLPTPKNQEKGSLKPS